MADPNQTPARGNWVCPCNGCSKAVKQERARITEAIEKIDLDAPHQTNAVGLKILIMDIVNPSKDASKK
jgi:hypothetical protein